MKVKNAGTRASDEVGQMYVQHLGSTVERAQIELKPHDLAYWDTARHAWRIEKEPVRVLAGGSSDKLPVQAVLQIKTAGEYRP